MKNKWWVLAVTTSGTSLVFLDNTVMPVALPTIQNRFHYSDVGLIWVVNAYLLTLMTLLLIGGRLVDLFGRKAIFNIGMTVFCLGSLLGGVSFSKSSLILGRVIQGIGGALIIPATSTLLAATFEKGQRTQAFAINISISSLFLALGPVIGGFLTEYLSWRYIFFVNLPIVIFGLLMSYFILPSSKRKDESFHFWGAIPLIISIVSLVIALMEGERLGWDSWRILLLFCAAPIFFLLFLWLSKKTPHPIIDLSIFKNSKYAAAAVSITSISIVVTITIIWSIYFQTQLKYTPSETGLIILTATMLIFLIAPLGGVIADRLSPKIPIYTGFLALFCALCWIATHGLRATEIQPLIPGIILFGCSIPLIFSPSIAMGLSYATPEKLGEASGMLTSLRQLGSTVGIALFMAIYSTVQKSSSFPQAFSTVAFVAAAICLAGLIFLVLMMNISKT